MTETPLRPTLKRLAALPLGALVLASVLAGCTGDAATPAPSANVGATAPGTPDATPSPSSTASPDRLPDFASLTVSTEGLGSLRLNAPVGESDMVTWNPNYCEEVTSAGSMNDEDPGRWVANYETSDESRPFAVVTSESGGGNVLGIEVYSDEVPTLSGIRIGSTMEELETTYPDLVLLDTGDFSSLYEVSDGVGSVRFEVIDDAEYWPEFASRVSSILVVNQDTPGSTRVGSGALIDACI